MKVDGTLTVNEQTYTLKNARGYHDHNWGYWNWATVGWDWGQVTQTKNNHPGNDVGTYAISFGNVTDSTHTDSVNSVLNVWKNKKVVANFTNIQINHSLNDTMVNLAPIGLPVMLPAEYPNQTVINATSDTGDWINITFTAEQPTALPIALGTFPPLPEFLIIWEIIGTYEVEGVIDGKPVSFVAEGFLEYAAKF
jgi:hypothetical protein